MNEPKECPSCGSSRFAAGRIVNGELPGVWFDVEESRLRLKPARAPILYIDRTLACLDCGLIWTRHPPSDVRAHVEDWGSRDLKARLLKAEDD